MNQNIKLVLPVTLCMKSSLLTQHIHFAGKEDQELTLDPFIKKVAKKIPHKWRMVGLSLGISQNLLDAIEEKHAGLGKLGSFVEVFSYWRRQQEVPLTWKALAVSLESSIVNEHDLAQQLRKEFMIT